MRISIISKNPQIWYEEEMHCQRTADYISITDGFDNIIFQKFTLTWQISQQTPIEDYIESTQNCGEQPTSRTDDILEYWKHTPISMWVRPKYETKHIDISFKKPKSVSFENYIFNTVTSGRWLIVSFGMDPIERSDGRGVSLEGFFNHGEPSFNHQAPRFHSSSPDLEILKRHWGLWKAT
jgi:hypothetical protein